MSTPFRSNLGLTEASDNFVLDMNLNNRRDETFDS